MEIHTDVLNAKNPVASITLYILTLILTYILPSEWKHSLIYLRRHNPLPGNRIFSELMAKDARISRQGLEEKYGDLPIIPAEQNALWYKIYKAKQDDKVISNSQGRWLLFRDLFSMSCVLFLPAIIFTFWNSSVQTGITFALIWIMFHLGIWICAHNTGIRFTCNVLNSQ
jgi:hypothetical protein